MSFHQITVIVPAQTQAVGYGEIDFPAPLTQPGNADNYAVTLYNYTGFSLFITFPVEGYELTLPARTGPITHKILGDISFHYTILGYTPGIIIDMSSLRLIQVYYAENETPPTVPPGVLQLEPAQPGAIKAEDVGLSGPFPKYYTVPYFSLISKPLTYYYVTIYLHYFTFVNNTNINWIQVELDAVTGTDDGSGGILALPGTTRPLLRFPMVDHLSTTTPVPGLAIFTPAKPIAASILANMGDTLAGINLVIAAVASGTGAQFSYSIGYSVVPQYA